MYNKDKIKNELTIEQVADLVAELGGEPQQKDDILLCKTICHCGESHKLYYYNSTHLFHCYTGCDNASFDIFDLYKKVKNREHNVEHSLPWSITQVASYFGIIEEIDKSAWDLQNPMQDWDILKRYATTAVYTPPKIIEPPIYDEAILKYLPHPIIQPWIEDGISREIMEQRGICYDPVYHGIVIPHYDMYGNLIGIRERTLVKENAEKYGKYRPAILDGKQYNHPLGSNCYNLRFSADAIRRTKKVLVFESEKATLQYATMFGAENDISVAVCGSNLSWSQFALLSRLGIKDMIIGFDRQYQKIGDNEYQSWIKKLQMINKKYGNYVNVSFIFDTKNLLGYKDSPTDKGKEVFTKLYYNRLDGNGK